ncbi:DUF3331 domain-containing protein [Burkholderia cepacia]|uniref:DUF3331 domain-containing protein n=1 Tax=Burkholderia cepacia TaxID=292 RepID=UPI0009C0621B|nr:DUF3331 domain-containing protein [Burkholderia cepacia]MBF3419106.1 DUF3331 domain-containing protein [Burkholderia pseudomallei]
MDVKIYILECASDRVVARWVEPGGSHYGEQIWRPRIATRFGVCAYSGKNISPGDPIFRPTGRPRPSNATAMILASEVP